MVEMILLIIVTLFCLGVGAFISLRPSRVIELQKKFYEKINWRIEPISMAKEIRNTRLMGLFLIFFVVLVTIDALTHRQVLESVFKFSSWINF
ncbi:MAG TPA: hypothetical protein PL155_08370 [Candidatus Omnitrophota bacterium]|nr:hypothetical protein [Candidatus Omnitrophota bacterium]HPD85154.1 hypothetical protein [Candidatus Omnitrophota bacterium]HRZ04345.1 hypothetical protein [Candidatus Omnitrophota bacterium]